jgi:hypothetical protein
VKGLAAVTAAACAVIYGVIATRHGAAVDVALCGVWSFVAAIWVVLVMIRDNR